MEGGREGECVCGTRCMLHVPWLILERGRGEGEAEAERKLARGEVQGR
jgi:hypothetical protein